MSIDEEYVREIFKGLETGDGAKFFEHVDDDVDWIVMGTHPLAGEYHSKSDFIAGTFAKLSKVLPKGAQLVVQHLLVKGDEAVVELRSLATAKNGKPSGLGQVCFAKSSLPVPGQPHLSLPIARGG
jgi:ketosteroid isomerase-like protein